MLSLEFYYVHQFKKGNPDLNNKKGGDIMPVEHQRGKTTKWQHTLSFSDREREIIEKHMEKNELTMNGAIRDIIRRYGDKAGY